VFICRRVIRASLRNGAPDRAHTQE